MKTIQVKVTRVFKSKRGEPEGEELRNATFSIRVPQIKGARLLAMKTFTETHGDTLKATNCSWVDRENLLLYCMRHADVPQVRTMRRRRPSRK